MKKRVKWRKNELVKRKLKNREKSIDFFRAI